MRNLCHFLFYLLGFKVAVSSYYQTNDAVPPSTDLDIIFQKSIQLLDSSTQTISIYRGQEPVDVIYSFGLKYGLDRTQRDFLLQHICSKPSSSSTWSSSSISQYHSYNHHRDQLNCTRDKALLFSTPVYSEDSTFISQFQLYEDVEPVDAAHDFVRKHNLDVIGYRNAILKETCDHVPCYRTLPIIWKYTISIQEPVVPPITSPPHNQQQQYQNIPVSIELLEGQELADVLFQTLLPWKVPREQRKQVLVVAKEQGIYIQRDDALVYQQYVVMNGTYSWNATLKIWDNGFEPIDTIYQFLHQQFHPSFHWKKSTLDEQQVFIQQFQILLESILFPHICTVLPCTRQQPCIWSYPITTNHGKDVLATVQILKDEEPIDVIDQFVIRYQLDNNYRQYLFDAACQELNCRRSNPIVFQKSIQDEDGTSLGSVQVFENEEVVDAVVRFLKSSTLTQRLDPITIKNTFFQLACPNPRVLCTRNIAHIFDKMIVNQEDNLPIGQLTITEYEEPVDKIYQWIQQMNVSYTYLDFLVENICSLVDGISCTRKKPLVFTLPLSDPDGNYIGRLEVLHGEEPVDALYKFFSRYHLFEKKWDFKALVQQVCQIPSLTCNRNVALQYFSENFIMGSENKHVGPLIIWETEEVVDKLYEKRMEYNLTLDDQMRAFSMICHQEDVYCSRTRAIVYKLTAITKRDYEKFGNETCDRKFAGWQYLSNNAGSYLGSRVIPMMKYPLMIMAISSPFFSPVLFFSLFIIVKGIVVKTCENAKKSFSWKLILLVFVFTVASIFHANIIEPENTIDQAMHVYEGQLPDLVVFENDEPVDILLKWGKLAAKDHHPIVREPIYWDILRKVCSEIRFITCRRSRAWHSIDMGMMTVSGQGYEITYQDRSVDPYSKDECRLIENKSYDSCVEESAVAFCTRIYPYPDNCVEIISQHISKQLRAHKKKRFDSKDTYIKLGLEMDAPDSELHHRVASILRSRGMNMAPFYRVDNGTAVYYSWDLPTREAFVVIDSYRKVGDPESRLWNDKPCTPYFGGALCAKMDKDGNMLIEV